MAEARQRSDWHHTAATLAMIHNVNVTKRSHSKSPAHFHPFGRRITKRLSPKESVNCLISALVPKNQQTSGTQ